MCWIHNNTSSTFGRLWYYCFPLLPHGDDFLEGSERLVVARDSGAHRFLETCRRRKNKSGPMLASVQHADPRSSLLTSSGTNHDITTIVGNTIINTKCRDPRSGKRHATLACSSRETLYSGRFLKACLWRKNESGRVWRPVSVLVHGHVASRRLTSSGSNHDDIIMCIRHNRGKDHTRYNCHDPRSEKGTRETLTLRILSDTPLDYSPNTLRHTP
jgi:hypothetical protein